MTSVVIYARVSTEEGQDTAAQVRVCQKYAEHHGYTVHQVYEDYASAVNFRGRQGMADDAGRPEALGTADTAQGRARLRPRPRSPQPH